MTDKLPDTGASLPEWPEPPAYSTMTSWSRETARANFNGWKVAYWESRCRLAVAELNNIRNAERFNQAHFENGDEFADWARSRARYTVDEVIGPLPEQQP
jgi:hypothetical protein